MAQIEAIDGVEVYCDCGETIRDYWSFSPENKTITCPNENCEAELTINLTVKRTDFGKLPV